MKMQIIAVLAYLLFSVCQKMPGNEHSEEIQFCQLSILMYLLLSLKLLSLCMLTSFTPEIQTANI